MSQYQISQSVWRDFLARFGDGGTITATVTRVVPFGALVELPPGVPGLLPRPEPTTAAESGSPIEVRIASVDVEHRRVSVVPA
ncbi:S1 RNA-binding domain-containing protein [Amycolatopsis endophytica]|uniref:Ribosomal protein S1 n=1 Tax=Amycolatopsis endophytica TaxID=860233 RepID=A0A853AVZ8_9PSEU|nr:S1 RNA-binding domain-containing protein [Amycolatopsis endophytica]NYI86825.1 ribosomal protein S1 [Amycolatopsis endophytica]